MKRLYLEVGSLDKRCYEHYGLSEDILMEHASEAMARFIAAKFAKGSRVCIVCGSGNNGADGIALGRILHRDYDVRLFIPFGTKSEMGKLQLLRAQKIGVPVVDKLESCDVLVDCLFGSGLDRALEKEAIKIIETMNETGAYKLACDIPSGVDKNGVPQGAVFIANTTITMGALKLALFSDLVKDFVGEIEVADLGISRGVYEGESDYFLLEESDLKLPHRTLKNTHKGHYGHLAVIAGEKEGAAILAASAALSFGAGLVTIISKEKLQISPEIMQDWNIPSGANSICIGMGLGRYDIGAIKDELMSRSLVLDADLFYDPAILGLLDSHKKMVITPHPKELGSLLKVCGIGDFSVDEVQQCRFKLAESFSRNYPNIVLLLKGANTIVAQNGKLFVNPLGSAALAKGGSGDVLAGLIASLLAQGYTPLDAAISGSLVHAMASQRVKNSYALTPMELVENIKRL